MLVMVFTRRNFRILGVVFCLAVLHFLLLEVVAQAPGDEDEFCTSQSVSIIPPSFPPNSKILMDSYNYISLLPILNPGSGVWQEVDVDGVADFNSQSQWVRASSLACRQTVVSCYYNLAPPAQNNWLITQHISRVVEGSVYLSQVIVQVEFQLQGCFAGCQLSFILSVWETSIINRTEARNTSKYRRIQRIAPAAESGLVSQNASVPVNFVTNESGFYLAFVDDNTCIAITRVMVLYRVCPPMVLDLVIYPQTLSPSIRKTVGVEGYCVEGASGEISPRPFLYCSQAGKWAVLQNGTGCQCNRGYLKEENADACSICPAGHYVSSNISFSCQPCPPYTRLDQAGVTECKCLTGYFRAAEESADFPCTQPPNQCTNLEVTSASESNIVIQWNRPTIIGRPDYFYKVFRSDPNRLREFIAIEENFISTNSVVTYNVTNLVPFQTYQLRITTHNNVSDQDPTDDGLRVCEVTASTLQVVPPNECTNLVVISTSDKNIVIQWNRPTITGGLHLFYKVLRSDLNRLGEFIVVDENFVNTNAVVTYNITNLVPFQMYHLRVTTHNNVSNEDAANDHHRVCEVTASTRQGVPNEVTEIRSFCSVIVWQPPIHSVGDIRDYELLLQPGERTRIVTNAFYITSEEEKRTATTVQVRGLNGAGPGSYSVPISIGCTDTGSTSCPVQSTPLPPSPTSSFHFKLKGKSYLNNTVVLMEDIGEDIDALLCVSNHNSCCYTGEFYYPNGSSIIIGRHGYDIYRNRGKGLGFIRLNRRNNATSPQGKYRCLIPDASGQNQSLYINIVAKSCPNPSATTSCPVCDMCPTTSPSTSMCPTCPPAPVACPEPATTPPEQPFTSMPPQVSSTSASPLTSTLADITTPVSTIKTTTPPLPALYFELRGKVYENNSVVLIEDIGDTDNALFCVSEDNPLCCNRMNYFYPNGTRVPSKRDGHSLWRNRGQEKSEPYIRLNRRTDREATTGVYRCQIPFTDIPEQNLYITIS